MVAPASRFKKSFLEHLRFEHVVAMDNCLGCGSCGQACAWFRGTQDPALHPQNRKAMLRAIFHEGATREGKWMRALGLRQEVSPDRIDDAMEGFWQCTTCGRCTMACPMGLDNRSLFHLARRAYNESGLMERHPVLAGIDRDTAAHGHSFGLEASFLFLRMGFFAAQQGIEIPLDVPQADYLFVCSAVGNTRLPDIGIEVPMLLNAAGVSYTISSRIVDTGTDVVHVTDNHQLARQMLLALEAQAKQLGVKALLVSECGCDARTFFVESAQLLGRPLEIPVRHLDAVLLEAIDQGRLPVQPTMASVTYHDPCKFTRLAGLGEMGHRLLGQVAKEVVEMEPHGARNLCCNGGSGPLRLTGLQDLRRRVSQPKVEQLRATGAERVVTPCAVCMLTLRDLCGASGLEMRSMMMFELVHEAATAALGTGNPRFARAVALEGLPEQEQPAHRLEGYLAQAMERGELTAHLGALQQDPAVQSLCQRKPDADGFLSQWVSRFGGVP